MTMAKRGRPRTRPEKEPPGPAMVYECIDRRGHVKAHIENGELSAEQAMTRLGVLKRPFQVTCWPLGQPMLRRIVQYFEG